MGAQKDMGLNAYAQAFAVAGLAVFVFDYRTFGGSQGEPRQWVSPSRHVEDWHAAVAYVKAELSSEMDTSRICLWGTSFAGGHVLATAYDTPGITAIISQVPHLDARAATLLSVKKRGIPKALLSLGIGLLDTLGTYVRLPPIYLPLVGPPGSLAFMQLDEFETKEYFSKHPQVYQGDWQNIARASLVWELFRHKYSPIKYVPDIKCPILFVAASEDCLCPVGQIYKAAKIAQQGQLLARDCTHFELYRGKLFEGIISEQVNFFRQHTGLANAPARITAAAGVRAIAKLAGIPENGKQTAALGCAAAEAPLGDIDEERDQ
eukprot:GHUV01017276.1.p1 GENE.GHUV01017276.1~~GHUV01017276.1.p1  ORF type:complete len:320 (+),score=62.36 GHUV01017276.1:621-1580(+)